MIYVNRDSVTFPEELLEGNNKYYEEEVLMRLQEPDKFRQARFKPDYKVLHRIRPKLEELFNDKCCYCESRLDKWDLEHFRPTSTTTGTDEKTSEEGYYWLAYKWFNIYLSCAICKRNKGNAFPVLGKRLEAPSIELYHNYEELQKYMTTEESLFLNPCDPDAYTDLQFQYDIGGGIIPLTEKAEYTVDRLQLNRKALVEAREQLIKYINNATASISFTKGVNSNVITDLIQLLEDDSTFLGLARQMIARWFTMNKTLIKDFNPDQYELIFKALSKSIHSIEVLAGKESEEETFKGYQIAYKNEAVIDEIDIEKITTDTDTPLKFSRFIEWIDIKNYKCIEYVKLEIPPPSEGERENGILLIGENGVGKSTILQAISLAMMGEDQLQHLHIGNPGKLIRRNSRAKKARIRVKFTDEKDIVVVEITKKGIMANRKNMVKPCVGIGSIRRLPESGETISFSDDSTRILGLFRHDVIYPDIQPWLGNTKQVNTHQFDEAAKAIIDMLMISDEFIGKERLVHRKNGKLTVNVGNGPESIEDMCDGHRSVIGYALYILRCLSLYWDSSISAEGLVIIDEIGNHLHPTWKIKIVSLLHQVFPRAIFVISTHDPLCLRSARDGEVWVMNKKQETQEIAIVQKDIPQGMSLETLLTGKWFYMDHTTDERTSQLIEEHSTEMFSETPDEARIKEIETQLERTVLQTPFGNTKLDTYLHFVKEVQSESISKLEADKELRDKLANRIRNQIKS